MDIYFSDFNEETQKAILEGAGLDGPEEANWDVLPITCLEFEYEEE